jgi:hypothetical protein
VLGHNPRWQAFGYDPKYSGFQPRPSVLRAPQLPVSPDLQCPTPSPSTCTPRNPNATNTGGSTTYQTPGNAQLTAQIGLAAQQATQPQYPSLAGTTTHTGGSTMYQTPGDAQITAHPGPAAQNAPSRLRSSRYPIFPGYDGSALHTARNYGETLSNKTPGSAWLSLDTVGQRLNLIVSQ